MTIPPRARTRDYFVAGGTLRADAPSYVKRPADEELFELILAGEFAYVLTTRQLGKSSLMTRTAHRLKKDGLSTATIDLTSLGMALEERWYLGLLGELTRQLDLEIDPEPWWQERSWQPTVQRFIGFLRDVVLSEIQEQVVIFIDEIDSTLRLDFSDDFFAGIRAVYNARAQEPIFERLTFVLLGVASPPDLIKERTRTPFNIGQGVLLQDFNRNDTVPLQIGLEKEYPDQSEAIFTRIYHWTDGHPYLTQKLCKEVVKGEEERWTNEQIDELVERTFLSDKALKEENLQFVRDKILTHAKQRQLLALYRKVHQGEKVADDAQSPLQTQLKLSGLVKTENGHLGVRNKIYKSIFDMTWVRENTKINWSPIIAAIFALVATLAIGYNIYNSWIANEVELSIAKFYQTPHPEERVTRLAQIFQMQGAFGAADYDHKARELFYSLPRNEQLALFEAHKVADSDMISLVQGLYTTLADVDGTDRTRPLLEAMTGALNKLDETQQTTNLQDEINSWLQGRAFYRQNQYTEARAHYKYALDLNSQNPATLYERARVLTELSKHEEALADLELVLVIAKNISVPVTPTPVLRTTPSQVPSKFTPISRETPSMANPPESFAYPVPDPLPEPTAYAAPDPLSAPTAYPVPYPVPYPTSYPSPYPPSGEITLAQASAITSEFDTSAKMIGAVRNFIQNNPELENALANTSTSQSLNLLAVVPLPTATLIITPISQSPNLVTVVPLQTATQITTPEETILNEEGISITSVRPSHGWNDEVTVVYIQGNGFAEPLTITLNDEPLEIQSVTPEIITAIVPAGLVPGSYNVKLKIAGEQATHFNATYDVLSPPDKDDLVSYPEWLWTDIAPLRVGYANSVGLNLQRLGGRRMLDGVTVEFELNAFEGRVVLGRSITHPLSPNRVEATAKVTWEPQEAGEHTICAIIDPDNEIPEAREGNNTICRTVMVLEDFPITKTTSIIFSHSLISRSFNPSVLGLEERSGERVPNKAPKEFWPAVLDDDPDRLPPVVDNFVIASGAPTTAKVTVRLDVTATDIPFPLTNGVQAIKFVEHEYIMEARRWVPVQLSEWVDYDTPHAGYSWTLMPTYGMRYMQVWALDQVGNISLLEESGIDVINLLPSEQEGFVAQDGVVFYRMHLDEGQTFVATLTPISGDPDLYVWGQSDESPWSSNNATGIDSVEFEALETGTYQIEVHGSTDAEYRLTFGVK